MDDFTRIKHLMSSLIREDELDGKGTYVVPTVLIVEGVHNNLYYSEKEIAKVPEAWNGRPVVVYHPTNSDGTPVTANSPEELKKRTIGAVYNAKFEDGKLKAEAWIDPKKANAVDLSIMNALHADKKMEVSTGMFTEDEMIQGIWNEEKYEGIVHNIRPDHLALLPDTKGACSWEDGAGMPRINEEKENKKTTVKSLLKSLSALLGVNVTEICNPEKEEPKINTKERNMDRVEKVKALIDSDKTEFTKDDSDFLTNLEEEQFNKIEKLLVNQEKVEKKEESVDDGEKKAKKEEPKANDEKKVEPKVNEKPKTAEEFISDAPKELAEILSSGLKMHRDKKAGLIKALVADARCKFSEAELETRSVDELIKLTDLAAITPDFSGRDTSKPKVNEEDDVPPMPTFNFDKK